MAELSRTRPGAVPSAITYCCYTAVGALLQALDLAQQPINRSSLQGALSRLNEVTLPDGVLPVREREVIFPMTPKIFRHGKIISY